MYTTLMDRLVRTNGLKERVSIRYQTGAEWACAGVVWDVVVCDLVSPQGTLHPGALEELHTLRWGRAWGRTVCPPSGGGVRGDALCARPPVGHAWGRTVCPPSSEGVCGDAVCACPPVRVCVDTLLCLATGCPCSSLSPSALFIPSHISVYLVLLSSPYLRAWSAVLGTLPTLGFDVACHMNKYQVTHYTDLDLTSVSHEAISDHTHICTLNPREAPTTVSYIASEAEVL